ncbi:TPA: hypothetical protein ACWV53_004551 [Salmonella enterica subsp. enterica serovar Muenchen]
MSVRWNDGKPEPGRTHRNSDTPDGSTTRLDPVMWKDTAYYFGDN